MIDAYRDTDFSLSIDERIRAYLATVVSDAEYNGFDTGPLRQTDFVEAKVEDKTTQFRFRILEFMCNKDGNLHGGAASTIFDNLSSTALFTIGRPGFWDNLGVSRFLSVVFHRPLPLNTTVELTCWVVSAGRRLTHLEAVMKTEDGKICASCIHEKVRVETPRL
jgi:acyl-coenzyme A thioesterase 13